MRVFRHVGTPLTQFGFAIFGMFGKFKHFLVCEHVLEGGGGKVFVLTPARAEVRTGSLDGTHPRRPRGRKWGRGKVLTGLHYLPLDLRGWVVRCQGNKPGGWTPHVKGVGKLVVLLRGVNIGFWSHIGCSRQTAIIFSREGLV